jgi:uncharacterized protein (TIGR03790 family)
VFFLFLFLVFTPVAFLRAEVAPAQVIVVANEDNADSMRLARHYMHSRGIPARNLVALSLSQNEEISWEIFARTLWNPLLDWLLERGWLRGERLPGTDAAGRSRVKLSANKIGYIVLCHGVPLRIAHDAQLAARETSPERPLRAEFATTTASVDSELATMASPASPANALVPNPVFGQIKATTQQRQAILIVSRLDGATFADCQNLVDNALWAEKNGLVGRAYVDAGGPHPQGDAWLKNTAEIIARTGFDLTREETPQLLDYDTRADAPALYFGWYSENIAGRFADASMRFARGAIALHIHSFSAATLRSGTRGWTAPLVARGATVTFGNVAEPYLQFTTMPQVFLAALLTGRQVGDAYALATPAWSWQTVLVGDPLYKPFKVPLGEQLRRVEATPVGSRDFAQRDYVLLRQANILSASGKSAVAQKLLAAAINEHQTLPLRLALARLAKMPALAWSAADATALKEDPGLLIETARYLNQNFKAVNALLLYRGILARKDIPDAVRNRLLPEAIEVAVAAGDADSARQWREQLPPPPPQPPPAPNGAKLRI